MAVTNIPNVQNWTVTPQNGQSGYFTLMNTWLGQSTLVIVSLQTAIAAQNAANSEINTLAIQTENNAIIATGLANYQGEWISLTTYAKGQSVSVSGIYYTSKVDSNSNHLVTDTNYWVYNPINDKVTKSGNETIDGIKSFLKGHLVVGASVFGYGNGSGGTVTQLTSKSTAVTLNKPCGQIIMNNAALAAGASVYFTLNNDLLSNIGDQINLSVFSSTLYLVDKTVISDSGYTVVKVTNNSDGSLSDSLVITFSIIKGATA